MEPWKVWINSPMASLDYSISFYRRIGNAIEVLSATGEIDSYTVGAAIKPTLTVRPEMLPELLKALVEHGVKLPDKNFVEGKLAATEAHLDDMRTLLKLKK